jgi:hypothetical protein
MRQEPRASPISVIHSLVGASKFEPDSKIDGYYFVKIFSRPGIEGFSILFLFKI